MDQERIGIYETSMNGNEDGVLKIASDCVAKFTVKEVPSLTEFLNGKTMKDSLIQVNTGGEEYKSATPPHISFAENIKVSFANEDRFFNVLNPLQERVADGIYLSYWVITRHKQKNGAKEVVQHHDKPKIYKDPLVQRLPYLRTYLDRVVMPTTNYAHAESFINTFIRNETLENYCFDPSTLFKAREIFMEVWLSKQEQAKTVERVVLKSSYRLMFEHYSMNAQENRGFLAIILLILAISPLNLVVKFLFMCLAALVSLYLVNPFVKNAAFMDEYLENPLTKYNQVGVYVLFKPVCYYVVVLFGIWYWLHERSILSYFTLFPSNSYSRGNSIGDPNSIPGA